jgi:ribosome maturation factor RimP
MKLDPLLEQVIQTAEPILSSQGIELVDLEYQREAQGWVLRLYIDREGGITLEDCTQVNRELGTVLEVKDLIPNSYTLEVSSPGLTRPLKKPADFNKYRLQKVKVKTVGPIGGRRNFKGILLGFIEDKVQLEVEKKIYEIPLQNIAKANLVFES